MIVVPVLAIVFLLAYFDNSIGKLLLLAIEALCILALLALILVVVSMI